MVEINNVDEFSGMVIPDSTGLGNHVLVDFFGCNNLPHAANALEREMLHVAELIGATVVSSTFHQFNPIGLSGVVVIAESHIAVHTWPEHNTACLDLFTCSNDMDPTPGLKYLYQELGAASMTIRHLDRGKKTGSDH